MRQGQLEDDKRYVYFVGAPHVVFYNPKLIKEADLPKSLDELTEPKWRGKVSLRTPLTGRSGAFLVNYMQGTRGNLDWYKKLGANKGFVGESGWSVHLAVQEGRYPIGLSRDVEVIGFETDLRNRQKKKSVLKYQHLAGDQPSQFQLGMINEHGSHPAAARLFFNWVLSDEARAHLEKAGFSVNEKRAEQLRNPKVWTWNIEKSANIPAYDGLLSKAYCLLHAGANCNSLHFWL